jgi:hypothetical protein
MTSPLSSGELGQLLGGIQVHGPGLELDAEPGSDLLLGTRRSDELGGGSGSDALFG